MKRRPCIPSPPFLVLAVLRLALRAFLVPIGLFALALALRPVLPAVVLPAPCMTFRRSLPAFSICSFVLPFLVFALLAGWRCHG